MRDLEITLDHRYNNRATSAFQGRPSLLTQPNKSSKSFSNLRSEHIEAPESSSDLKNVMHYRPIKTDNGSVVKLKVIQEFKAPKIDKSELQKSRQSLI